MVLSSSRYVAYIDDAGNVEKMPCSYADGKVTFETGHFSCFAVKCAEKDDPMIILAAIFTAALIILAVCKFFRRRY